MPSKGLLDIEAEVYVVWCSILNPTVAPGDIDRQLRFYDNLF